MRATFKKSERICSKRIIDRIFAGGSKSFAVYPLRAVFQMVERPAGSPPVMVLFSVSKRHFKHSVDRNRGKRQLREAYRKNKVALWGAMEGRTDDEGKPQMLCVVFLWLSDKLYDSVKVEETMVTMLDRIQEKLPATAAEPQNNPPS